MCLCVSVALDLALRFRFDGQSHVWLWCGREVSQVRAMCWGYLLWLIGDWYVFWIISWYFLKFGVEGLIIYVVRCSILGKTPLRRARVDMCCQCIDPEQPKKHGSCENRKRQSCKTVFFAWPLNIVSWLSCCESLGSLNLILSIQSLKTEGIWRHIYWNYVKLL